MAICHEIGVIVPVELSHARVFQLQEEPPFHLLEKVETHEDIMLEAEVGHLALHHVAIQHALIGQAVAPEVIAEGMIQRAEGLPYVVEPLLQHGVGLHLSEERLKALALLVGEEGEVAHLLPRLKADEELVGIHEILVEVIEVGKHELAPREEMVERLIAARELDISLVKAEDEVYLVGDDERGMAPEEVADGEI